MIKERSTTVPPYIFLLSLPFSNDAGFNVRLTITTDALDVVCEDGDRPGETICHHPMQGVSFASGSLTCFCIL